MIGFSRHFHRQIIFKDDKVKQYEKAENQRIFEGRMFTILHENLKSVECFSKYCRCERTKNNRLS